MNLWRRLVIVFLWRGYDLLILFRTGCTKGILFIETGIKRLTLAQRVTSDKKVLPREVRGLIHNHSYIPPKPDPARGVFSELTALLTDLARGGGEITSIATDSVFSVNAAGLGKPSFSRIFKEPAPQVALSPWLGQVEDVAHLLYRDLPWQEIRPFAEKWFQVREQIQLNVLQGLETRELDLDQIIAVNLRGSTKIKEVIPARISFWVETVDRLRQSVPGGRVVLFSEDQDLVDSFTKAATYEVTDFGQEVRVRRGASINDTFRSLPGTDSFVQNFIGRTWLISRSRRIVTHTGNTAFWTCVFRGCACDVYQFTASGLLAEPYSNCASHPTKNP